MTSPTKLSEAARAPLARAGICILVWLSSGCEITHRDGTERRDAAAKDAAVVVDAAMRDAGKKPNRPDAATKDPNDEDGGDGAPVELSCEDQLKESLDGIPDEIACIVVRAHGVARYIGAEHRFERRLRIHREQQASPEQRPS